MARSYHSLSGVLGTGLLLRGRATEGARALDEGILGTAAASLGCSWKYLLFLTAMEQSHV